MDLPSGSNGCGGEEFHCVSGRGLFPADGILRPESLSDLAVQKSCVDFNVKSTFELFE